MFASYVGVHDYDDVLGRVSESDQARRHAVWKSIAAELGEILDMLGIEPRQLMRTKEAEYKENGLDDPSLSRDQLIAAMVAHPKLIERPIVVKDGKAAIGRPPEKVLEIL